MNNFLLLISIPFFYINGKIILSDLKSKIIPNKYLLFLIGIIPIYYFYYFYFFDLNIIVFILKIFFSLIISFFLYYYGIWSAGDAKYLLVLSLFIPQIGIVNFIGNIALITIIYLFFYFVYFYSIKLGLNKHNRINFINSLYIDFKEKIKNFLGNNNLNNKQIMLKITKFLLIFLIIFVAVRLSRMFLISNIKYLLEGRDGIKNFLMGYFPFISLITILSGILCIYIIKKIIFYINIYLINHKIFLKLFEKKNIDYGLISSLIILLVLVNFLIYEYLIIGNIIFEKLYLIFTIYLGIYLFYKILLYLYKITFHIAEQEYKDINNLKAGEIVDINDLVKSFGNQECLNYLDYNSGNNKPEPKKYFLNINNPIDQETVENLKKIYKEVDYHCREKKFQNYSEKKVIKILKTFSFSQYIFLGFLISFFVGDYFFRIIFEYGFYIIKNIYS